MDHGIHRNSSMTEPSISYDYSEWKKTISVPAHLTIQDILDLEPNESIDLVSLDRNDLDHLDYAQYVEGGESPYDFLDGQCIVFTKGSDKDSIRGTWNNGYFNRYELDEFKWKQYRDISEFERTNTFLEINYDSNSWYPLNDDGKLPDQGVKQNWIAKGYRDGKSWTEFPTTTRLGWRGPAIPINRLKSLPNIHINKDKLNDESNDESVDLDNFGSANESVGDDCGYRMTTTIRGRIIDISKKFATQQEESRRRAKLSIDELCNLELQDIIERLSTIDRIVDKTENIYDINSLYSDLENLQEKIIEYSQAFCGKLPKYKLPVSVRDYFESKKLLIGVKDTPRYRNNSSYMDRTEDYFYRYATQKNYLMDPTEDEQKEPLKHLCYNINRDEHKFAEKYRDDGYVRVMDMFMGNCRDHLMEWMEDIIPYKYYGRKVVEVYNGDCYHFYSPEGRAVTHESREPIQYQTKSKHNAESLFTILLGITPDDNYKGGEIVILDDENNELTSFRLSRNRTFVFDNKVRYRVNAVLEGQLVLFEMQGFINK